MSDTGDVEIPPTEAPESPEAGPDYWPNEWQRHIDRAEENLAGAAAPPVVTPQADWDRKIAVAEQNLAENPPPVFPAPAQPDPVEEPSSAGDSGGFDPGNHTVAEVEDYVNEHPDERARVLDAERSGKDRVTLVDWLDAADNG